jgi:hypothetical protein
MLIGGLRIEEVSKVFLFFLEGVLPKKVARKLFLRTKVHGVWGFVPMGEDLTYRLISKPKVRSHLALRA